jgi:hypothetical protein
MDNGHLVKVSVFLPERIHRLLKLQSVERRTSLQRVISKVAEEAAGIKVAKGPEETIDALSLVNGVVSGSEHVPVDARTIRTWQNRLKRVLESGNRLAILNSTTSIEAMEALVRGGSEELRSPNLHEEFSTSAN